MSSFPYFAQLDNKDCGPTCLKIILKHYGKNVNIQKLRFLSETTRTGSNLQNISDASEKVGFRSLGVKISLNRLQDAPLPCILHWNKDHYVVLYKIKKNNYYISDPAIGLVGYSKDEFLKFWIGNNSDENTNEGIALLLEPTPKLHQSEFDKEDGKNTFGGRLPGSGIGSYEPLGYCNARRWETNSMGQTVSHPMFDMTYDQAMAWANGGEGGGHVCCTVEGCAASPWMQQGGGE